LCVWIDKWLGDRGYVDLRKTEVIPTPEEYRPPSTELRFVAAPGFTERWAGKKWLLAESWWKSSFVTPKFADMTKWAFQGVPWTVTGHFATQFRRVWKKHPQGGFRAWLVWLASFAVALGRLVLAAPLSVALFLVVVLLQILAIPPIPWVRKAMLAAQRLIALTIGDTFVLLQSSLQRGAIVAQVRRDLYWLAAKCRAVAIVAHSQGAAISFDALRDGIPSTLGPEKLSLFTFGSGLNKLLFLRIVAREKKDNPSAETMRWFEAWAAPAGLSLILIAMRLAGVIGRQVMSATLAIWPAFIGLVSLAWGISIAYRKTEFKAAALDPLKVFPGEDDRLLKKRIAWTDCYANKDPVPNGPLFDDDEPAEFLQSHAVQNRASFLGDHTAYWKNEDQFVSRVMADLEKGSGIRFTSGEWADYIRLADLRRPWRVAWLVWVRRAALLLALLVLPGHWKALSYFGGLSLAQVSALGKVLSWNFLAALDAARLPRVSSVVGALVLLVPVFAAQQLLHALWRFWDWSDLHYFRSRSPYRISAPFLVFALAFVLLAAIGPFYAFQAVGRLWAARAGLLAAAVTAGGAAISMFAVRGWWVRLKAWRSRRRRKIKSKPSRRLREADRLPWPEIVIATLWATLFAAPLVLWPPWVAELAVILALALYWLLRRRLRRELSHRSAVGPVESVLARQDAVSPAASR
jgi:hypothetical protein